MRRRKFLQSSAAAALASAPTLASAAPKRRRPNLLYVFDDQHRAASMPGEPHSPAVAPALDAFRRANFSMDRCVSNYPLCTPYRGMLMTGRWPFQSGITNNGVAMAPQERSLGRLFKDQGYHTAYVGKWHLGHDANFVPPGPNRHGFDDWHVWGNTNAHFSSFTFDPVTGERQQPQGWAPVFMTDQAVDIVKRRATTPDTPWLMIVSYNPPHPPYEAKTEDERPYDPSKFSLRPNVRFSMRDAENPVAALHDDAALRKVMLAYYGAITGIDRQFERLLKVLDETGQSEDTIVVFTSDHGEMMGSQGRMQKQCPFEESIRVPFVVRYPGVTKRQARSETLFNTIDIYPTLCGLAGLPVPRHCAGRDLSTVMRGGALQDPPHHSFLMNNEGNEEGGARGAGGARPAPRAPANTARYPPLVNLPKYRGIRTDTHTYAVSDSGRWLLFDNVADPYQMNNLIADPAQRPLMDRLDAMVEDWLHATGDPFPYAENKRRLRTI